MLDFKPPKLNKFVMGLSKWGLPFELLRSQIEVQVVDNGLKRFNDLRGKHVVIVSNHSNQYDPEVVFTLSKIVGEDFHFICAREVFDWVWGSVGWWFQSLGVYSILRGEADTDAFDMTRRIIADGTNKLVMFPEGEVTRRPDFLMPLRRGSTRLFFEGQEELLKRKPDEPVYVVPIGIRYRYKHDITSLLNLIVGMMEWRLNIRNKGGGIIQRVQAAAAAMLSVLEEEYLSKSNADLPYEERVCQLRAHMLERMSVLLGIEPPQDCSHLVWLRRVINGINEFVDRDMYSMSAFQRQLHERQVDTLKHYVKDCRRVQHLVGVAPPKEPRPLTQERLAAVVSKVEREVLGFVIPKGPRIAMVGVGEPISLLDYWTEYQRDSQEAVDRVTDLVASKMQGVIDDLDTIGRGGVRARSHSIQPRS